MNKLDEKLKNLALTEREEIPREVHEMVEQTLGNLPEKTFSCKRKKYILRPIQSGICAAFIALVILPNISVAYGEALEKVPFIGDFVRVVTVRNYNYEDRTHELDVKVPAIEGEGLTGDDINQDIETLTDALVQRFYENLEEYRDNSMSAIYVDYEVVTNTEKWFTLRLNVTETAASSYNYFYYYHIDKVKGEIVELKDLFEGEEYITVLTDEVKRQMRVQMDANENVVYWLEDEMLGENLAVVSETQNFYFDAEGNLVLVYDEFVVGPGYMGCPEFTIDKDLLEGL